MPQFMSSTDTLTNRLRSRFEPSIDFVATALAKRGVHPDALTVLGLMITMIGAGLIAMGEFRWALLVLLIGLPADFLDGAVARAIQRTGNFGAILDSTLDRYADGFIFLGFVYYFADQQQLLWMLIASFCLIGSFLVSYVRARAEGLDVDVKVGWFTRVERIIVVLVILLVPTLIPLGLVLLAVGTNLTALHRLRFTQQALLEQEGQENNGI